MNDNDPIDEIHKIREKIYEELKALSKDEFIKFLNEQSKQFIKMHSRESGAGGIDELFLKINSNEKKAN